MEKHIQETLKSKSKIEKDLESVKPTVINDKLIQRYIVQYNKENQIYDQDDMKIWDLTHLSLSYLNIVEIDNLVGLEKLVKLQLDNNIIMKIKGLDTLVNLQWLDLSFNSIQVIENLDFCYKISDLSLYSNHIRKISGLENLKNLNVLSLGKNKLSSLDDSISYLSKLKNNLQVLKLAENDFSKRGEKEYSLRIIAHLKNLKYLDYELITQDKRNTAIEEHKDEISNKENGSEEKTEEDRTLIDPELEDAKITVTVKIFMKAIDSLSDDERKVKYFSKFQDLYQTSDGQIEDCTAKYQADMKFKNKDKNKVIKFCMEKLR